MRYGNSKRESLKAMNHRFKFMEFMVIFIYLYTSSPSLIKQQQRILGPPATLPPSLKSMLCVYLKKQTNRIQCVVTKQNSYQNKFKCAFKSPEDSESFMYLKLKLL